MERISEEVWVDSWEKQVKSVSDKRSTRLLMSLSPSGRKLQNFVRTSGKSLFYIFALGKQVTNNKKCCKN